MVAALLDLEKGAALAFEAVDEVRLRSPPQRPDVVAAGLGGRVALRLELGPIAEDAVDLGQCGVALRGELGGAAGDDDRRLGMLAGGAADRLARLALGLGGDRAGIDDDRVA